MALTDLQRNRITMMRAHGIAYARIARHLELNPNSVKTYCLRAGITIDPNAEPYEDPEGIWCLNCCKLIELRRGSKFCCTECRRTWWKYHRRTITQELTCRNCGQTVTVKVTGSIERKYCSHPCFIQHRFKTRGGRR
ncbi:hypothetical protein [Rothia sp. 32237D007AR]